MNNSPDTIDEIKALILMVDDATQNLQIVSTMLRKEGYEVITATSGVQALDILENTLPDLILLEVMMPEMSGLEVCRILKNDEATLSIPVIFLTANVGMDDLLEGFQAGAVDYVTKPFQAQELLIRIRTHLLVKQAKDLIEQQVWQLKMNARELKQLNTEKNELLEIVAHALKNPLSTIQHTSRKIQQGATTTPVEMLVAQAAMIELTTVRMFQLIKNMLDVNALESGKMYLNSEPVELVSLIQSICQDYQAKATNKQIQLHYEDLPLVAHVVTDRSAARQIVENLLSNAIKYSPFQRRVWLVAIELTDAFQLSVRDEGPGLCEEEVQKLFSKFVRLTPQPTGGETSTGLGLSIAKKLVEKAGGQIWCESEVGVGSTFFVKFPR